MKYLFEAHDIDHNGSLSWKELKQHGEVNTNKKSKSGKLENKRFQRKVQKVVKEQKRRLSNRKSNETSTRKTNRPLIGRARIDRSGLHVSGMVDPGYKLDNRHLKTLRIKSKAEFNRARERKLKTAANQQARGETVNARSQGIHLHKEENSTLFCQPPHSPARMKVQENVSHSREQRRQDIRAPTGIVADIDYRINDRDRGDARMGTKTPSKLSNRQRNMLMWVRSLIGDLGRPVNSPRAAGIAFRDGLLLSMLVARILDLVDGVRGIEVRPQSQLDCLQNLNASLIVLRSPRVKKLGMSSKYLWSAPELEKGEHKTLFGLLSGLHQLYRKVNDARNNPRRRLKMENYVSNDNRKSNKKDSETTKSTLQVLDISEEQAAEIVQWIQGLGLGLSIHSERWGHGELLRDDFRNGVLLCKIAGAVSTSSSISNSLAPHENPASLAAVRENIAFAMSTVSQNHVLGLPSMQHADSILRGGGLAMWELLWRLMTQGGQLDNNICGNFTSDASPITSSTNQNEDYSQKCKNYQTNKRVSETSRGGAGGYAAFGTYNRKEMRLLEQSLLLWMWDLGVLDRCSDGTIPRALQEDFIGPCLMNGTLLAQIIEEVTGETLRGINRKPHTSTAVRSNFLKALKHLRRNPRCGKRYVRNVEKVSQQLQDGNRIVWLHLLEDCHRLAAGVPPRPVHATRREVPFFGRFVPVPMKMRSVPLLCCDSHEMKTDVEVQISPLSSSRQEFSSNFNDDPDSPLPFERSPEADILPRAFGAVPIRSTLAGPMKSPIYNESKGKKGNFKNDQPKCKRVSHKTSTKEDEEDIAATIAMWFDDLRLKLPDPASLCSAHVKTFSDGILLCRLVETLEHHSLHLKGVDKRPKAKASRLKNIRVALEFLRTKKQMPLDNLWNEEEIYIGNGKVIRSLLMDIRKAYGHHLRRLG
eukprot:g2722.t1